MCDYWIENAARNHKKEKLHTLVDFGYVRHQAARDNADRVLEHVSTRNIMIVAFNRLLIRIPPTKVKEILQLFPEIKAGGGYSWTTHRFGDLKETQFVLKGSD